MKSSPKASPFYNANSPRSSKNCLAVSEARRTLAAHRAQHLTVLGTVMRVDIHLSEEADTEERARGAVQHKEEPHHMELRLTGSPIGRQRVERLGVQHCMGLAF